MKGIQTWMFLVSVQCTVISGSGGISKSTIAKVYARKQCDYYDGNGIRINAETLRNSIIQFLTIRLNFSEDPVKTKSDSDFKFSNSN